MKKMKMAIAATLAASAILPASADSGEPLVITSNKIDTYGDFDYELWRDKGDATMRLNENGTFECEWDKSTTNNVLFRTGRKFDTTKTYSELGDITLNYGSIFEPDGNSYLCVYGWTVDPLIEFYVIEAWGNWRPPGNATPVLQIDFDGGTYDVYETTRTNMPSIQGTQTFQQYWSVRTEKSTEGTVSVSEHFKMWENLGMPMGKMYEVALCVEGFQSSGYANVYSNMLTIGDETIGAVSPKPETTPPETEATEAATAKTTAAEADDTDTDAATDNEGANDGEQAGGDTQDEPKDNNLPIIIGAAAAAVAALLVIIIRRKGKK